MELVYSWGATPLLGTDIMKLNDGIPTLCLILSLGAIACVSTGSVVVSKALTAPITSGPVTIEIANDDGENKKHGEQLKAALGAAFREAKFTVGETGGITIKVNITSFDAGDTTRRAMNMGGEAQVEMNVEVVKDGSVISNFVVTGNSARTSSVSIGGYNTKWGDNLSSRALLAAAEKTVEYLAKPAS